MFCSKALVSCQFYFKFVAASLVAAFCLVHRFHHFLEYEKEASKKQRARRARLEEEKKKEELS